MSAGNNGGAMPPDHDDDPFAYLYRPDGQAADGQAAPPPRPPSSYHQVRPVGERTFGGQGGANRQPQPQPRPRQQPQPDAYYAAPETQAGGPAAHSGVPGRRRQAPEPPRRNGLLIGAIAVVLAVVLGVGAAILFSGDDTDPTANGEETTDASTDGSGDTDGNGDGGEDDPSGEESPPVEETTEPPVADLAGLQLGGGARIESAIEGARSPDGSYITGLTTGSTLTWTFDFQGEPGQYHMVTTYSAISDGHTLDFSVNGTPRTDGVNLEDFNDASDDWADSWTYTYNFVDLVQGPNTVQFSCGGSCDVLIDQLYFSTEPPS